MAQAYIALGTNLGDRLSNVRQARSQLAKLGALRWGPVIQSQALLPQEDPTPQPPYLNSVDSLETALEPVALLEALKRIEVHMGRKPAGRWAPRLIDLDLVLYGHRHINERGLTVPHPRMHERRFVLEPLVMLAPDVWHPVLKQTARSLLQALG
jgi:2-amino-4-hydroxy-6-hydroxymethyldihydropteridine diphosphokinase